MVIFWELIEIIFSNCTLTTFLLKFVIRTETEEKLGDRVERTIFVNEYHLMIG